MKNTFRVGGIIIGIGGVGAILSKILRVNSSAAAPKKQNVFVPSPCNFDGYHVIPAPEYTNKAVKALMEFVGDRTSRVDHLAIGSPQRVSKTVSSIDCVVENDGKTITVSGCSIKPTKYVTLALV
jgi:hypothetical protein